MDMIYFRGCCDNGLKCILYSLFDKDITTTRNLCTEYPGQIKNCLIFTARVGGLQSEQVKYCYYAKERPLMLKKKIKIFFLHLLLRLNNNGI